MAGALFGMPYPEFDTIAGIPLVGGSVTFEADGDPARVHADQAFRASLGHVVQLSATGRLQGEGGAPVNVWVDPLIPYDVTVKDAAGAEVWAVTGYRQPDPALPAIQIVTWIDNIVGLTNVHALHRLARVGAAMTAVVNDPSDSEEGIVMHVQAVTAFAHVLTFASGIANLGAGADTVTLGGAIGDGITIIAVEGFWHLVSSRNAVVS